MIDIKSKIEEVEKKNSDYLSKIQIKKKDVRSPYTFENSGKKINILADSKKLLTPNADNNFARKRQSISILTKNNSLMPQK